MKSRLVCTIVFSVIFLALFLIINKAEAAIVEWASLITNTNATNPQGVLGKPDGNLASFSDSPIKFGTISGYGDGDNIAYDNQEFATLLGVSESILNQIDVISIEYNGGKSGGNFEGSNWLFEDGKNSISVSYTYNDDSPAPILALGTIGNADYSSYFGITNPWGTIGELGFILFDIDGTSNVNPFSQEFIVTLTAGGIADPLTPNPDVIGRFSAVPIPGAFWLLGSSSIAILGFRRKYMR